MKVENKRRIVHTNFQVAVPPGFQEFAVEMAIQFIEWLTTQTDVYVRMNPGIMTPEGGVPTLFFRAGLDRNPKQEFPGKKLTSVKAWEELGELVSGSGSSMSYRRTDMEEDLVEKGFQKEVISTLPLENNGELTPKERSRRQLAARRSQILEVIYGCHGEIQRLQELIEDCTDEGTRTLWNYVLQNLSDMELRLKGSISRPCPACGCLEFDARQVIQVAQSARLDGNIAEYVGNSRHRYVCVKCGAELTKP